MWFLCITSIIAYEIFLLLKLLFWEKNKSILKVFFSFRFLINHVLYVNERLSVEERMNKIIPLFSLKKISWPPSLAKINRQKKYVCSNSEVERQFSFMNAYPRHDIVVLGISFFEILLKKISEEWKKSENLYSATSLHIKVERGYANILDNLCVFM